jgi:hypothetical protein
MRVLRVELRHFRGFDALTLDPSDHVVLVGEPRAGRSALLEGLRRVLLVDGTRVTTADELDFHRGDTSTRAEIEVVLGNLGETLEQEFFDHIEPWDPAAQAVAQPAPPTETPGDADTVWVLRLCYRAQWDEDQERADHWVDFPGESDPDEGDFARITRRLHSQLPVVLASSSSRPLTLGPQAMFRRLVDASEGGDLGEALDDLVESIEGAGAAFAGTGQIQGALNQVLSPLVGPLGIEDTDEVLRFVPEGGSLSGVLRSLAPALDLGQPGHLPLARHGSTTTALVQVGEALAGVEKDDAVILFDDFGEHLDALSAKHLAAIVRRRAGQAWLATRRSTAVEAFAPSEVIRLYRRGDETRAATLPPLTSRASRVAARHLSGQLLPAASAKTVAILEGPHDRAAVEALARRLSRTAGTWHPAAAGVALVDAAGADGSGGSSAVIRLAAFARRLGFRVVAVIDWDANDAPQILAQALDAADVVVRLPERHAIERAILSGLADDVVRSTTKVLCSAFNVEPPTDLDSLSGISLQREVRKTLKGSGGLHSQFIDLLPAGSTPALLRALLRELVKAADPQIAGHRQL